MVPDTYTNHNYNTRHIQFVIQPLRLSVSYNRRIVCFAPYEKCYDLYYKRELANTK